MIVTKVDEGGLIEAFNMPDLHEVKETSDSVIFTHVQDTRRIQEQVYTLKQDTDRGFTKERKFQWTARIPATLYAAHPEFIKDPDSLDRWLMTEEGSKYRIANGVTTPKRRGRKIMEVNREGKVTLY